MTFLRCFSVISISSQTHIIRTAEHTLLEHELKDMEMGDGLAVGQPNCERFFNWVLTIWNEIETSDMFNRCKDVLEYRWSIILNLKHTKFSCGLCTWYHIYTVQMRTLVWYFLTFSPSGRLVEVTSWVVGGVDQSSWWQSLFTMKPLKHKKRRSGDVVWMNDCFINSSLRQTPGKTLRRTIVMRRRHQDTCGLLKG